MGVAQEADQGLKLAQKWCVLSLLHNKIEQHIEAALQSAVGLSVREFSAMGLLEQNSQENMQMNQLAERLTLSLSATTRLVARLEERNLLQRNFCYDDRRCVRTVLTEQGLLVYKKARPINDAALQAALEQAEQMPELKPFVALLKK